MPQDQVPQVPQASRDQFEIVFRHAPTGLCLIGLDGRILSANPVMCSMVGYGEAELLERSVLDITLEEDRALTAEWLRNLRRDPGGTAKFDKRYVHKQGHVVWAAVSVRLHRDAAGVPDFSVTHVQDVTLRKQAEAVLREHEDKFRIAFENAPMGMSIIGPHGEFLAANPTLSNMFGYSKEEILAGT